MADRVRGHIQLALKHKSTLLGVGELCEIANWREKGWEGQFISINYMRAALKRCLDHGEVFQLTIGHKSFFGVTGKSYSVSTDSRGQKSPRDAALARAAIRCLNLLYKVKHQVDDL